MSRVRTPSCCGVRSPERIFLRHGKHESAEDSGRYSNARDWPRKGAHMRTPAGHKVYAMAAEYPSAAPFTKRPKWCAMRDSNAGMFIRLSQFMEWTTPWALGKSWLSAVVLAGGITGLCTAALVEFGPSSILYPLVVHGKPTNFFTVPAFSRSCSS